MPGAKLTTVNGGGTGFRLIGSRAAKDAQAFGTAGKTGAGKRLESGLPLFQGRLTGGRIGPVEVIASLSWLAGSPNRRAIGRRSKLTIINVACTGEA
jgi:hypothetical protein